VHGRDQPARPLGPAGVCVGPPAPTGRWAGAG
jgi:hypothetical protein